MSTTSSPLNSPHPEGGRTPLPRSLPRLYYLSAPLFLLLDYGVGINIRTCAAEGFPLLKAGYSMLLVGLALLSWYRPTLVPFTGVAESALTVSVLILRTFLGYLSTAMGLAHTGAVDQVLTPPGLLNLILSGTIGCLSFYAWSRRWP